MGTLGVSPPNRQAKEAYALFGLQVPNTVSIAEYRSRMFFSSV